jgi:hypothetical protein
VHTKFDIYVFISSDDKLQMTFGSWQDVRYLPSMK